MPQAIPAVAAWVFNAVSAAGFSAATAAAAQAVVYATATAAVKIAAAAVISKVFAPKVKSLGSTGTQTSFKADPQAGMPFIIGRTAVAGYNVFTYPSGDKNKYLNFFTVLSGFGPLRAFESFLASKVAQTFNAGGAVTSGGSFAGKMWMIMALGLTPAAALATPTALATSGPVPEWTSAHKLSGKAAQRWALEYDGKVYSSGVPQPLTVVQGIRAYDPRLDSTYPGGSGAHRANDPATWGFSSYQNPYTAALTYLLGYWENGKRVGGVGVAPAMIDFPAFVEGANVADINGWRVGGEITSQDSKWAVLSNILQAGGGEPLKIGAKISCRVNMPRTSLAMFTESGVAGAVQVPGVRSRRERKNSIIPRYRSEAHDWQIVAASAITATEYQTEDGGLRSKEVPYSLCQNAAQAGQLAGYDLVNAREIFPITIAAKPAWMGYRPGDCITLNLPEMGLIAQKAIILNRDLDLATGTVSMTLTSETEGKHAFALGQTATPPATPGLTVPDFETVPAPAVGAFTASVGFVTSGSNALPAISITGVGDNPFAKEIVIEYRVVGTSDWIQWAKAPASTTAFTITGLDADQTYEIAISYISVLGVPGTRRIYGPYTTTGLSVSDAAITAAKIADGAITTTKFANGIAAPTIVAVLPTTGNYQGRLVILTTDNKLYRYTGTAFTAAVPAVDITGTLSSGQIADAAITVAKFASGISAPTIAATLPTTGNFEGRLVFLTTDGVLYRYTGGAFTANVASANVTGVLTDAQLAAISATKITGQVVASQIADGTLTTAKFASGIAAPTIVAVLPTTGNYQGRLVILTTDNKLYRYTGSAFVATVASTDISGTLTDAQLAAISAAKITGQIASTQIADGALTANKLANGLTFIENFATLPTTGNFAGRMVFLTTDKKLYRYDGTAFTASVAAVDINGQLTTTQIAPNSITSAQITANTITAGNIAAGTITADEIAANSITASKLTLTDTTNLIQNNDFKDLGYWTIGAGMNVTANATIAGIFGVSQSLVDVGNGTTTQPLADASTNTTNGRVGVEPSKPFRFQFGYYMTSGSTCLLNGIITWYDAFGVQISGDNLYSPDYRTVAAVGTKTNTVSATFTSPANASFARITMRYIWSTTLANAGTAYMSAPRLTRAVNAELIVDGTISATKIAANTITANEIAANAITANEIAANAITAVKISANSIDASKILAGSITASELAANSITAGKIAAGAVSATEIAAGAITTSKLAITQTNLFPESVISDVGWWSSQPNAPLPAGYTVGGWYIGGPDTNSDGMGSSKYWAISASSSGGGTGVAQVVSPTVYGASADTTYEVRGTVYNVSNRTARLTVQFFDRTGTVISPSVAVGTLAAGAPRTTLVNQITAPAGTVGYRVYCQADAGSAFTGAILLSNIIVRQAAEATLIVDGSIIASKIAADSINASKIVANSITAAEIAADTITAGQIAAGAITANELAANSVIAGKIAAGAISASEIAAGAITASKIAANTITAAQIAANSITAAEIAADTITAGQIAAGAIGASEIAAGAITAGKIAAGAITANELAVNSVTAGKIAAGTITGDKLNVGTITADKITTGTITTTQMSLGAVTGYEFDQSATATTVDTSAETTIASVTITTEGGFVDISACLVAYPDYTSGYTTYDTSLYRGSTLLVTIPKGFTVFTYPGYPSQGASGFFVDEPPAGTYTYSFRVTRNSASGGTRTAITYRAIKAIEFKC